MSLKEYASVLAGASVNCGGKVKAPVKTVKMPNIQPDELESKSGVLGMSVPGKWQPMKMQIVFEGAPNEMLKYVGDMTTPQTIILTQAHHKVEEGYKASELEMKACISHEGDSHSVGAITDYTVDIGSIVFIKMTVKDQVVCHVDYKQGILKNGEKDLAQELTSILA